MAGPGGRGPAPGGLTSPCSELHATLRAAGRTTIAFARHDAPAKTSYIARLDGSTLRTGQCGNVAPDMPPEFHPRQGTSFSTGAIGVPITPPRRGDRRLKRRQSTRPTRRSTDRLSLDRSPCRISVSDQRVGSACRISVSDHRVGSPRHAFGRCRKRSSSTGARNPPPTPSRTGRSQRCSGRWRGRIASRQQKPADAGAEAAPAVAVKPGRAAAQIRFAGGHRGGTGTAIRQRRILVAARLPGNRRPRGRSTSPALSDRCPNAR